MYSCFCHMDSLFFFPDKYYCTTAKNQAFNLEGKKVGFLVPVLVLVLQFFDMHLVTHSESYTLEFH